MSLAEFNKFVKVVPPFFLSRHIIALTDAFAFLAAGLSNLR